MIGRGAVVAQELERPDPRRFEQEVQKLEQTAAELAQVDLLFVGSSSIRLWDLPAYFPGMDLVNHGFGGSHIADTTWFAPRLIFPFQPRVIVLYAGDNDIAFGLSPQQVADDYSQFSATVRRALPQCRIVFISIKPSLARWRMFPRMQAANAKIRARLETDQRSFFVDMGASMLGADGQPRQQLFVDDGLHLSPRGYELWTRQLRPVLAKALSEARP